MDRSGVLAPVVWSAVLFLCLPAQAQTDFTPPPVNADNNATILVPDTLASDLAGTPLMPGDQIGVFVDGTTFAGAAIFQPGQERVLTFPVNGGGDKYSGYDAGEQMTFKVKHDASVFEVAVRYEPCEAENPVCRDDGRYENNRVYTLSSIESNESGGGRSAPQVVAAINAGGPAHTVESGLIYEADARYSGGRTYATGAPIDGTSEDVLYQTERFGDFSYSVPVEQAGTYRVTLRFAEVYWQERGKRVFDVSAEEEALVSNLDLVDEAGAGAAYDVTRTVEVADGRLDLAFSTDVNNAKLSALLVEKVSSPSDPGALQLEGFSASASRAGTSSPSASGVFSDGASKVRLQWRMRSERTSNGLKGFRVLRKVAEGSARGGSPASSFEAVGFVASNASEAPASEAQASETQASESLRYRFLDTGVPYEAERVVYRLLQVGRDGKARQVGADQVVEIAAPGRFALEPNYPNPFREATTLRYRLKTKAHVRLAVYDALGRKVRTLVGGERQRAGRQSVRFEARELASGA